jgi:mycothiol synthase
VLRLYELTPADLTTAHALIEALHCSPRRELETLRLGCFGDPTCPPDLLLVAEVDGQMVGVCLACLRGERGIVKLFGVSAAHRRQGIGSALFGEIEKRLLSHGAQEIAVEGAAPNHLTPGVNIHQTAAVSFLMGRGYQTDRKARVDMAVALREVNLETAAVEQRLRQKGIVLRRVESHEVPAVGAFALETFSPVWQDEVLLAADLRPVPLFAAFDGQRVVAFAAYNVTGISRFGPTGTHPDYRGRGIGSALLKLCLRTLRDAGESEVQVSWAGPIDFYARAVDARISNVYWCFLKSWREEKA